MKPSDASWVLQDGDVGRDVGHLAERYRAIARAYREAGCSTFAKTCALAARELDAIARRLSKAGTRHGVKMW